MSPDQFLKHWGFVALRTDPVRSDYVRATYAYPGQRLNDGHHYQAESAEEALRGLHIYLQTKGLKFCDIPTSDNADLAVDDYSWARISTLEGG